MFWGTHQKLWQKVHIVQAKNSLCNSLKKREVIQNILIFFNKNIEEYFVCLDKQRTLIRQSNIYSRCAVDFTTVCCTIENGHRSPLTTLLLDHWEHIRQRLCCYWLFYYLFIHQTWKRVWQTFFTYPLFCIVSFSPTVLFRFIFFLLIDGFRHVIYIKNLENVVQWPTLKHTTVEDSSTPATNSLYENKCRQSIVKFSIWWLFQCECTLLLLRHEAFSL